jgi:hypothetical protein
MANGHRPWIPFYTFIHVSSTNFSLPVFQKIKSGRNVNTPVITSICNIIVNQTYKCTEKIVTEILYY